MNSLKYALFVARLQGFADLMFDGSLDEVIEIMEAKRRAGEIPLVGTEAQANFVAFLKELKRFKPAIDDIAKRGNDFARMMQAGASGRN